MLLTDEHQLRVRDSQIALQVEQLQLRDPQSDKCVGLIGLCMKHTGQENHLCFYPARVIEWFTALSCFQQHNLVKWMCLSFLQSLLQDCSRIWVFTHMYSAYLFCHAFCALASRPMNTAYHHLYIPHLLISSLTLPTYVGQRLQKFLASAISCRRKAASAESVLCNLLIFLEICLVNKKFALSADQTASYTVKIVYCRKMSLRQLYQMKPYKGMRIIYKAQIYITYKERFWSK